MDILELLYASDKREEIEKNIKEYLNTYDFNLGKETINSTRAVGDTVEEVIKSSINNILRDYIKDFNRDFARRAMADCAFFDKAGNYFIVDIKTHRSDTNFNMPNLSSVKRILDFYEDEKNVFSILLVKYSISEGQLVFDKVSFLPVETISWNCLTIGNLGWGQIQIANSNKIELYEKTSRINWMICLCDQVMEFYDELNLKIAVRKDFFLNKKKEWEAKEQKGMGDIT